MFQAPNLTHPGFAHGFFTRQNGNSSGIYQSRNCGLGSNDDRAMVLENRRSVAKALGTSLENLVTPYQTHSAEVVVATTAWAPQDAPKGDAIITKVPGLAIGVLTADCVPVLFAEAENGIVGAAHAGWRGAIGGVLDATVNAIAAQGGEIGKICAAVGPAISQPHYEVGEKFQNDFLHRDKGAVPFFCIPEGSEEPHFDLLGYVCARLKAVGILNIYHLRHCTFSDESHYFSYRRAVARKEPDYGRQISAVMIS